MLNILIFVMNYKICQFKKQHWENSTTKGNPFPINYHQK